MLYEELLATTIASIIHHHVDFTCKAPFFGLASLPWAKAMHGCRPPCPAAMRSEGAKLDEPVLGTSQAHE